MLMERYNCSHVPCLLRSNPKFRDALDSTYWNTAGTWCGGIPNSVMVAPLLCMLMMCTKLRNKSINCCVSNVCNLICVVVVVVVVVAVVVVVHCNARLCESQIKCLHLANDLKLTRFYVIDSLILLYWQVFTSGKKVKYQVTISAAIQHLARSGTGTGYSVHPYLN